MSELVLGLDGTNPLHFLATVGLLRLVDDKPFGPKPKLAWRDGDFAPILTVGADLQAVCERIVSETPRLFAAPRTLEYLKREKNGLKRVASLRAPVAVWRSWMRTHTQDSDPTALAILSGLMTETGTEELKQVVTAAEHTSAGIASEESGCFEKAVLQTHLDFTCRNEQFVDQLAYLISRLSLDECASELSGGAGDALCSKSLYWDPAADAPGAQFPNRVTKRKPVLEWLAFLALSFLPVFGRGGMQFTTACRGQRKRGRFVWSLWKNHVSSAVVKSILSYPNVEATNQRQRHTMGLIAVLGARLGKGADGYTGVFSPTEVY